MTDPIERIETIIDRIAEQGANDPNPNKLVGHLKLLDELALNALEALRGYGTRLDALERLLMPSTAVSADVVATPSTITSTASIQENE